ncbi:MAG: Uma2 family endonuclease [Gemmatimonadaceae bacterium]
MPASVPTPIGRTDWTAEMARALPDDGKRYEVLDGELFVTPAPSADHQEALTVLLRNIDPYVRQYAIGHVFWSPADIEFSPRRLVQPDLFVAPLLDGKRPRTWRQIRGLILAVETLSPSTARADRQVKSRIYMNEDVGEYWIVDLDARVVERWRKGESRPEILSESLGWQPRADLPPLTMDLAAYFAEVLGGE